MNDYQLQAEEELWHEIVDNEVGPKVTKLRAYPGWAVREYRTGQYDATSTNGALSPGFESFREAVAWVRTQA